jgi:type IV secretory pathway TraG/TraD family ATPase VirD4
MGEPLGDARWSRDQGISRAAAQSGRGFFFGNPADPYLQKAFPENFVCKAADGHLLTVAATRAGKGVSLIIPNLLCYRGSAVVIDPKGENCWITAPRRRALGQKIRILDPWNEVNRRYGSRVGIEEELASFNPLSVLIPGSDDFGDHLAYLADALIITESKEPYWDNAARELWAGLMAYVVESPGFHEVASLSLARKLLSKSDEELKRTIRSAIDLGSKSVAATKLARFENLDKNTALMSVVSTAMTQTVFLENQVLSRSMERSDFSFDDLREGGPATTVYLVLPAGRLDTDARWLRLMVSIAIGAVQKGPLEREWEPEQIAARETKEWEPRPLPETESVMPDLSPGGRNDVIAHLQKYMAEHPTPKIEPLTELPPSLRPPPPSGVEKFLHGINEGIRKKAAKKREEERAEVERATKMLAPANDSEALRQMIRVPMPVMSTSSSGTSGPLPVLLLLDEFGSIGRLAAVSKAYGLMAGLGMVLWAFVQDLNQLKRDYPNEWETFIGNVNAMVCFGLMDQFTCEYVSKMMGTKTVRYKTVSKQTSASVKTRQATFEETLIGAFGFPPNLEEPGGTSTSESSTDHVVGQPLCSPDVIRTAPPEMMFVIGRGDPAICGRVSYYKDSQFSAWARPDPKYARR